MAKKEKVKGGKGASDDQLIIETSESTSVKAGKGNDVITDRGGNNDQIRGGGGDDTVQYHYSGNETGSNDYDADKGSDTLELYFTRSQWMQLNPTIQADLDGFLAHLSGGSKKGYEFQSVGIEAAEFEFIRLFVDAVALAPEDDNVSAVSDSARLDENTSISGSVVANDSVADLVRRVDLLGTGVARGMLQLDSDGGFLFATGDDFETLAMDETTTVEFTYRVTDATNDSDDAVMVITVNGENDAPTLASTSAAIEEDGSEVAVDLAALGDDIDSDNNGATLTYSIHSAPAEGLATIDGTDLHIQGGSDFQYLAVGETKDIVIGVTATDAHQATAQNEVQVTVTGSNDLPELAADQASVAEDGAIEIDVLANDSDVDSSDILRLSAATGALHGTVELIDGNDSDELANDLLLYTPDPDFSGTDSFTYTVDDGNGGIVSQTATVDVDARADAPLVSHEIIAGESATQFTLRITAEQTDLDGSEIIDRIQLTGTTPGGGAIDLSPYADQISWTPDQARGDATADFNFTLPAGMASSLNIEAEAFSKEPSNGNEASSTTSLQIDATGNSRADSYNFAASNQSIWANGNAFNYTGNFTTGGSLNEDAEFGTSVIGPIDIRVAGTGATTHFSTVARTNIGLDLGLESRVGVNGGEVDASLNYSTNVTSTLNKTTDVLSIRTDASNHLPGNGFTASTPNVNFEQSLTDFDLDMSFGVFFWGYLHIHYTAGTSRVVHMPNIGDGLNVQSPDVGIDIGNAFGSDGLSLVRYDGNALHLLEGLYTQTEYSGTREDGLRNELFSWVLNSHAFENRSDSVNWSTNQVTGSESRAFATLTFDLDGIAAHMFGKPNPVHQEIDAFTIGPLNAGAGAELLDVDLVLAASYRQDNFLQPGNLRGSIVFEDDSRIGFTFGDEINVSNASARDANDDGSLDYYLEMQPDARFQTNAYIDLSLRDEVDILSVNINGGVDGFGSIGVNAGPLEEYNGTVINQNVPIQLIGSSFALNVETIESQLLIV